MDAAVMCEYNRKTRSGILESVAAGSTNYRGVCLAESVTKEGQIEMVRKHLRNKRRNPFMSPSENLQDELDLNNTLPFTYLTSEEIIRFCAEIYGKLIIPFDL